MSKTACFEAELLVCLSHEQNIFINLCSYNKYTKHKILKRYLLCETFYTNSEDLRGSGCSQ